MFTIDKIKVFAIYIASAILLTVSFVFSHLRSDENIFVTNMYLYIFFAILFVMYVLRFFPFKAYKDVKCLKFSFAVFVGLTIYAIFVRLLAENYPKTFATEFFEQIFIILPNSMTNIFYSKFATKAEKFFNSKNQAI
jgi:hypothetical protein